MSHHMTFDLTSTHAAAAAKVDTSDGRRSGVPVDAGRPFIRWWILLVLTDPCPGGQALPVGSFEGFHLSFLSSFLSLLLFFWDFLVPPERLQERRLQICSGINGET